MDVAKASFHTIKNLKNGMAKIVITTESNADAVWWMALANKLGEKVSVDFDFGGLSASDCPEIVPKEKNADTCTGANQESSGNS